MHKIYIHTFGGNVCGIVRIERDSTRMLHGSLRLMGVGVGWEREIFIELYKTYKLIHINNKNNLTLNIMQIINQGGYEADYELSFTVSWFK